MRHESTMPGADVQDATEVAKKSPESSPAFKRGWKCGNEFAPYHPSASHVQPDHRDGWNACYTIAAKCIDELEAENGALRIKIEALNRALARQVIREHRDVLSVLKDR